jgi:hypothetical protein
MTHAWRGLRRLLIGSESPHGLTLGTLLGLHFARSFQGSLPRGLNSPGDRSQERAVAEQDPERLYP